jgi:putative aminopeptidase FrvX
MELLRRLCGIHAPAGQESAMQEFLLEYINRNKTWWKNMPQVIHGEDFQHCIILVFGQPRTAVFAHIDNIGFTVRYNNELVKIGGPRTNSGYILTGEDDQGIVEGVLECDEDHHLTIKSNRTIATGTALSFKQNWREDDEFAQSCYMDNRLGVYNALKLAETLQDGVIVFSCWEEHGGGSVPYIVKYLWENFKIRQALISDITWITEGVQHGKGVVVSLRDSGLPRKVYVDRIRKILSDHKIDFQLEVESSGGSDGNEIQKQPYPIDWCFVGAAEDFVHSPDEKVSKHDIRSMITAYELLMEKL